MTYKPPKTKVSGSPKRIRLVDGAEDGWFYEMDKAIDIYVWPNPVPGHVNHVVHVSITRAQLLKYIERSKP